MDRRGDWKQYDTEAAMKQAASGHRVQRIYWEGPGWYWVETWQQPCPRGCCYDDVIQFTTAAERADAICREMTDLAGQLRDARSKR